MHPHRICSISGCGAPALDAEVLLPAVGVHDPTHLHAFYLCLAHGEQIHLAIDALEPPLPRTKDDLTEAPPVGADIDGPRWSCVCLRCGELFVVGEGEDHYFCPSCLALALREGE